MRAGGAKMRARPRGAKCGARAVARTSWGAGRSNLCSGCRVALSAKNKEELGPAPEAREPSAPALSAIGGAAAQNRPRPEAAGPPGRAEGPRAHTSHAARASPNRCAVVKRAVRGIGARGLTAAPGPSGPPRERRQSPEPCPCASCLNHPSVGAAPAHNIFAASPALSAGNGCVAEVGD